MKGCRTMEEKRSIKEIDKDSGLIVNIKDKNVWLDFLLSFIT